MASIFGSYHAGVFKADGYCKSGAATFTLMLLNECILVHRVTTIFLDIRLDSSMQSHGVAAAPSDAEEVLSATIMRQLEDVESRIARMEVTQTEICAVLDPLTHGTKLCRVWNA
jgi:hypothetical protein